MSELMAGVASGLDSLLQRLRRQRASSMFAQIAVRLEATLGGLFKVDVEDSNDTKGVDEGSEDEARQTTPEEADEQPEEREPTPIRRASDAATEIEIQRGTDADLDGRLVAVSVTPGKPIVAIVNGEHPHIITALERQPVNQMLPVSFIVSELSKELVKSPSLLIKTRL